MKSIDIHAHLDKSLIRDFLAKASEDGYKMSGYGSTVTRIKAKIAELQEELTAALKYDASVELIHDNGWEIYDVSDAVEDYDKLIYFPFVGTQKEYEDFIKNNAVK